MAKRNNQRKTAAKPAEPKMSASEFCSRLSAKDSRIELIAAFLSTISLSTRDTESNFKTLFVKFQSKAVE